MSTLRCWEKFRTARAAFGKLAPVKINPIGKARSNWWRQQCGLPFDMYSWRAFCMFLNFGENHNTPIGGDCTDHATPEPK